MSVNTKDKNWFLDVYDDLKQFMQDLIKEVLTWFKDISLDIFELMLEGVVAVLSTLPIPDFLADGIDTLSNALPSSVLWMLGQTGVSQGLAIFGAGVMFRLTRKAVTMGRW